MDIICIDKKTVAAQGEQEAIHGELTRLLEAEGLAGIVVAHPDVEILEVTGFSDVEIPASISTLQNLTHLAVENATTLPQEIKECQKLEMMSLRGSQAALDVSVLKDLPNLLVLNVTGCPRLKGLDALDSKKVLLISQ